MTFLNFFDTQLQKIIKAASANLNGATIVLAGDLSCCIFLQVGRNSDIYVTMVSYTHQVSYLVENSGFSPDSEFSVYFLFSAI